MKISREERDKILAIHGVDHETNDYGVKDQSNTYRIKDGVFYRGFDVFDIYQLHKEKEKIKAKGLKCFSINFKEEGFWRIFWEEKVANSEVKE